MLRILKGIATFLFFVAASIIIALPICNAFYGPAIHHHHQASQYPSNNKKAINPQISEHGIHDTSWELIKRRTLSVPPLHLKIRPLAVIYLLFSLFFFNFNLTASRSFSFYFSSGRASYRQTAKYIFYKTFLI